MIYQPIPERRRHGRRQATRRKALAHPDWHFARRRPDWTSLAARFVDWLSHVGGSGRRWMLGAASLLMVASLGTGSVMIPVFASVQAPPSLRAPGVTSIHPLALPELVPSASPSAAADDREPYLSGVSDDRWTVVTVQRNQTLGSIFADLGLSPGELHRVVHHGPETRKLARLFPGEQLAFRIEGGSLRALQFDLDERQRLVLTVEDDVVATRTVERALERRVSYAAVEIRNTLFGAATAADLSDALVLRMVDVFNFDIDFARDLQPGDRFTLVYEEIWRDGEKLRDGEILAASFVNAGKRYEVFRFAHDKGVDYLTRDGRSRKQAFIRTPLEFSRISSRFSLARRHPILGTMRAHRGVDYAAPTGTPIKATGQGVVRFAGHQGGYGKVVILAHGKRYTTLYGHMSRFADGVRVGSKVSQGQVIGYVGMTGMATGPHLHYEFQVDGQHRDPLSVKLPISDPIGGKELIRFQGEVGPLIAQLATMEGTLVAGR